MKQHFHLFEKIDLLVKGASGAFLGFHAITNGQIFSGSLCRGTEYSSDSYEILFSQIARLY